MTGSFTTSSCSSAATFVDAGAGPCRATFRAGDYDLAATLTSGQAFRWQQRDGWWEGVIGSRWVRLRVEPGRRSLAGGDRDGPAATLPASGRPAGGKGVHPGSGGVSGRLGSGGTGGAGLPSSRGEVGKGAGAGASAIPCVLIAETATGVSDWHWLTDYLRWEEDLATVLATFPEDEPLLAAVRACRGLRLLRQQPWECLASFILSSTKQIVQIRQIVARLCEQFGEQVIVPKSHEPVYAFPSAGRVASAAEAGLRACKMGFRAPNLRAAAGMVAAGEVDLEGLAAWPVDEARGALMALPGVGRKIADCVLLFAYGRQDAFPVDVWVMKALRGLYFPGRRVSLKRLRKFAAGHFGPHAGYAQQYLFHYARVHVKLKE